MDNPWVVSLGFICVGPILMIGFGFWLGRITTRIKISFDKDGETGSNRYTRNDTPPPASPKAKPGNGARLRRIQQPGGQGGR